MSITAVEQDRMAARLAEIRPFLDERAWRLLLGAEARAIGYGGMKIVAAASKAKADTVSRGAHELESGIVPDGRVRAVGAGRPAAVVADPGLAPALEELVAPETRGDPESALRWTTKSTSRLADELSTAGHEVSADTVGRLLKAAGYSLQGNAKTVEGKQHPDRDAQFRYINTQVAAFQASGDPVISVDAKKKEPAPRGALPYP
jgi:transposase